MFTQGGRQMRRNLSLVLASLTLFVLSACSNLPPLPGSDTPTPTVAVAAKPAAAVPAATKPVPVSTPTLVPPAEPAKPDGSRPAGMSQATQPTATVVAQSAPNPTLVAAGTQLAQLVNGPSVTYSRDVGGVQIFGIPDKVTDKVDQVAAPFRNPSGVAPHVYGDEGCLIMEADAMDTTATGNPYAVNGRNPGAKALYESGGCIRLVSPQNRVVPREGFTMDQNLPEGGFVEASGGEMSVYIPRDSNHADPNMKYFAFKMPYREGHNYIFTARGLFADGKQDSDRNRSVTFSGYKRGHIIVDMYQSRFETNAGFVSEEGFMQRVATSHAWGTNCGAEGCSKLTLVALDTNTGALEIYTQTLNQEEARAALRDWRQARKNWNRTFSNFR